MIHTNRIVTVGNRESIIDNPIILYRGDREVEVEFTLIGNKFTFTNEGNVIKSTNATHGQLVINTPTGENMFSEVTECHEGKVVFVITKEMIDELIEVGFYSFQLRLFDETQVSRVTIPPVFQGIDIRDPIAAEDETNIVDISVVDYSIVQKDEFEDLYTFLPDGNYNKTDWESRDLISAPKLNKIEDALYTINENMEASDLSIFNRIESINQNVNRQITAFTDEADAEIEAFERNVNTNVEQFKIDTNAAMTAHKNEVSEELESVNSQLEQKTKLLNNRIEVINNTTDTKGTIDLANFAQQGLSSPPIGVVVHHYTDGILAQFDNVGEGNDILVLKNAQNSTRRADKDENFVGSGSFLRLMTHNDELGYAETNFIIDKYAELIFTKSTAVISQNKEDDGLYAYVLKNYKAHNYIFSIINADKRVLSIINDVALTRLVIQSDTSQTNGMYINSKAGNIRLDSAGGWIDCINKIRIRHDANTNDWKTVARIVRGTSADRPTDFEIGECYFDADLNKPIWRNKTNDGWVDATGNPV